MSTVTSVRLPTVREASDTPPLLIHPSAQVLLTADVQATLDRLVELLENEARTQGIPISKVEVHGFVDPEEDTDSVIVTQWVAVPSQTALVYWDHLGAALEAWTKQLPTDSAAIVAEQIAVEVRWETDGRAA